MAVAGAPTFSGNDVIVTLTGVTDAQYVTVTLSAVTSTDGGSGGTASARVGYLAGDVSQNRVVTFSDMTLTNGELTHPVTTLNFLKDVNFSGSITFSDLLLVNGDITHALPTP